MRRPPPGMLEQAPFLTTDKIPWNPLLEHTAPVYPEPSVPKNPVLGWAAFHHGTARLANRAVPCILDLPHVKLVTSARIAIALALQRMGVGENDEVLIPAYHCLSMVEPVVWSGATPRFYAVTDRLEVGLAELESADLSRVKAILVTHFFGFPQPMRTISAFCQKRGIRIIEDCAHAMFGSVDGRPLGHWGEFGAGSLMKFFPVFDGGCLVSARHDLSGLKLRQPSVRFQAKSLLNAIERGLSYGRFPGVQAMSRLTMRFKDGLWVGYKRLRFGRHHPPRSMFVDSAASEGTSGLDVRWLDRTISTPSRLLIQWLPIERVIARRRHNYRRLVRELSGVDGAKALFPELPNEVVPYVFPLLIDRPAIVFERLRRAGMPVFRWEALSSGLDPNLHAMSLRYATALFQIPCHQELTDEDLSWMIATLRAALLDS